MGLGAGLDVIGWVLVGAGAIALAVTFLYLRPRKRRDAAEAVDDPTYLIFPDALPPPGPPPSHAGQEKPRRTGPARGDDPGDEDPEGEGGSPNDPGPQLPRGPMS